LLPDALPALEVTPIYPGATALQRVLRSAYDGSGARIYERSAAWTAV